jgi:hypothetical protein
MHIARRTGYDHLERCTGEAVAQQDVAISLSISAHNAPRNFCVRQILACLGIGVSTDDAR